MQRISKGLVRRRNQNYFSENTVFVVLSHNFLKLKTRIKIVQKNVSENIAVLVNCGTACEILASNLYN